MPEVVCEQATRPRLDVVAILKLQHKKAKATVDRLEEAIRVLESLGNHTSGRGGPRRMSAEGRKRIAAARRKAVGGVTASEEALTSWGTKKPRKLSGRRQCLHVARF